MSLNLGLIRRVVSFKRECKCIICIGFQCLLCMTYSGFSILDGVNLFISNLSNGIDLYSLCTMQRLRHYESLVTVNVPFRLRLHAFLLIVLFWGMRGAHFKCMTGQQASLFTAWNTQ